MTKCELSECTRARETRIGYCLLHYKRWKRTGDPSKLIRKIYGGTESHPLYTTWLNMRQRCYNKNKPQYKDWGGRGIKVCDSWNSSGGFERFVQDVGNKPTLMHQLDRINNDGDYEPGNVRWATRHEQMRNTRGVTDTPGVRMGLSGSWQARIKVNKKEVYLGTFSDKRQAVAARLRAEKVL